MDIMAQLLKSRFRNGFVPISVETDTLAAQPTLLRTSGLFTVDFRNVQPRSAWRMLALNALIGLRLSSQPLHLHSEIFFFRFFSALRHATYRTTS
jgi:hypothetical protein